MTLTKEVYVLVKKITIVTFNIVGGMSDNNAKNRILTLYLSAMVIFSTGNSSKQNMIEYFNNVKKTLETSKMPSDIAIVKYCDSCLAEIG